VWKQKKVWEGFIKCCQRTKPQSFAVILQLPAQFLQELLNTSPDLKVPLLEHVKAFSDNQVRSSVTYFFPSLILNSCLFFLFLKAVTHTEAHDGCFEWHRRISS
jgi:hypothetical protein